MAIPRKSTSPVGLSIARSIKKFIDTNGKASLNDTNVTPEEGAEQLANAIAYGVCKALSDSKIQAAWGLGI